MRTRDEKTEYSMDRARKAKAIWIPATDPPCHVLARQKDGLASVPLDFQSTAAPQQA